MTSSNPSSLRMSAYSTGGRAAFGCRTPPAQRIDIAVERLAFGRDPRPRAARLSGAWKALARDRFQFAECASSEQLLLLGCPY